MKVIKISSCDKCPWHWRQWGHTGDYMVLICGRVIEGATKYQEGVNKVILERLENWKDNPVVCFPDWCPLENERSDNETT